MPNLIADRNTLQMLQGVEGYNNWNYWVFEKPLTQLESESEDTWLERLLHTAMAIEEQIVYTQTQPYADTQAKEDKVDRLTDRLRDFREIIGFIPTIEGIENPEYLKTTSASTSPPSKQKRTYTQSKLLQVITLLLKENFNASINDVWSYFHKNQGEEVFELIEIVSVNDLTSQAAIIYWRDAKTGIEGKSQTRKSMATAIGRIRKTIKNQ